jgi:hypothetical protein
MFKNALAAGAVAILLVCAPLALSAQEREARAAEQASVLGWLSGVWGDIAAWLAGKAVPGPSVESGDGGCWIDPAGCAQGG